MCYQLSLTKVDAQSAISWTVVGQLKVDNTSDLRQSTALITVLVKLCLQQDSVARVYYFYCAVFGKSLGNALLLGACYFLHYFIV